MVSQWIKKQKVFLPTVSCFETANKRGEHRLCILYVCGTKEHCARVIKCHFERIKDIFLCRENTPLYKKGTKENKNGDSWERPVSILKMLEHMYQSNSIAIQSQNPSRLQ